MSPRTIYLALAIALIPIPASTNPSAKILIDCGSLAGSGAVLVFVGAEKYLHRFRCGREA